MPRFERRLETRALTKILSLPFDVLITSSRMIASRGFARTVSSFSPSLVFSSLPLPFSFALHPPAPVANVDVKPAAASELLDIDPPGPSEVVGDDGLDEEEGTRRGRLGVEGDGLM